MKRQTRTKFGRIIGLGDGSILLKSRKIVDLELDEACGARLSSALAGLLGVRLGSLKLGIVDG